MVGLHACGDLTTTAMHIFDKISQIKLLILLPCCYHRKTLKSTSKGSYSLMSCRRFPRFCQTSLSPSRWRRFRQFSCEPSSPGSSENCRGSHVLQRITVPPAASSAISGAKVVKRLGKIRGKVPERAGYQHVSHSFSLPSRTQRWLIVLSSPTRLFLDRFRFFLDVLREQGSAHWSLFFFWRGGGALEVFDIF